MSNQQNQPQTMPAQHQDVQPGHEDLMNPQPTFDDASYTGSGKLKNKVAIITGGDSGIGRAVAVFFAKEGANVVISYLDEEKDAEETKKHVEKQGQKCLLIPGDIGDEKVCQDIVSKTVDTFGSLDILVNNAAEQHPQKGIEDITSEQLERTFRTNIF